MGTMDTEENLAGIIVMNASLQSYPQLGVSGQVKISDIGKMKRRFGADYAFVDDKHDLVGNWYDPQTTEDVKIYCATDAVSSRVLLYQMDSTTRATVPMSELSAMLIMEYRMPMMVVGLQ